MSLQSLPEHHAPINGPDISRQLRDLREKTIRSTERYDCFSRAIRIANEYLECANEAYEVGDRQAGDLYMAHYHGALEAAKAASQF